MCALSVGTAVAWQVTARPGAHCAAPLLVQGAWTFDPLLPLSRAASVIFRYFPVPIHCAILDLKLGIHICIIYTPNLGLRITIPGREREQGRFRGSTKGAKGRSGGARASIEGARGSTGEHRGSTEGAPREH